jgi:hypothetical protein
MARRKTGTIKVEALLVHETDRAWLLDINDEQVWVPKSVGQFELHDDAEVDGTLEVEEWFAEKNDLT